MVDHRKLGSHTLATTSRRDGLNSYHAERSRVVKRIDMHRAFAEEARNQLGTIDKILDDRYTTELPSNVLANRPCTHQTQKSSSNVDKPFSKAAFGGPYQIDEVPLASVEKGHLGSSASGYSAHSAIDDACTDSEYSYDDGILLPYLYGENVLSKEELDILFTRESMEVDDEYHSENDFHPWFEVDTITPWIAQRSVEIDGKGTEGAVGSSEEQTKMTEGSGEADALASLQVALTCKDDTVDTTVPAPSSSHDMPIPVSDTSKGKEKSSCSLSSVDQHDVSQNIYSDWIVEAGAGQQEHFILRQPPRLYHPDSTSDIEQPLHAPPEAPMESHLTAVTELAPDERIRMLREFLHQNTMRFDEFRARMQPFSLATRFKNKNSVIETIYSPAWDHKEELRLLTKAVSWIDALMMPFRTEILAEDEKRLKPRLQEVCRHLHDVRIPMRSTTEAKLSLEESATIDYYCKEIAVIQTSNISRKTLLEQIDVDVAFFENLVLSAENIRYRYDIGRSYGLKDDLVDGLRRIYSTVVCTIPVGLLQPDRIEQRAQEKRKQHGFGPFDPYRLLCRPELSDNISRAAPNSSAQGYTAIQVSERQNPLNTEYWHSMKAGISQVVAAQKQDKVGNPKLRRNPSSMGKDSDAFYSQIYEDGMAKYSIAAARGIEEGQVPLKQTDHATQQDKACAVRVEEPKMQPSEQGHRSNSGEAAPSESSVHLEVGSQKDLKPARKGHFCLMVNKPGGCMDWDECGYDSHNNKGRLCQSGRACTFGENCAFVHDSTLNTASPKQLSSAHPNGSDLQMRDLRPILAEVLANPKKYKVCTWVNKSKGCSPRNGKPCAHNHTLKGIICEEDQKDECSLGYHDCPLRHVHHTPSTFVPTTDGTHGSAINSNEHTSSDRPRPTFRPKNQKQDHGNVCLTQRNFQDANADMYEQRSQISTMHNQAIAALDLPQYIPAGPRAQYTQPAKNHSPISGKSEYISKEEFHGFHGSKRKREDGCERNARESHRRNKKSTDGGRRKRPEEKDGDKGRQWQHRQNERFEREA